MYLLSTCIKMALTSVQIIGCAMCKPETAITITIPKMVDIHFLTVLCLTFRNRKLNKNDKTKKPTYTWSSENIFSRISHPLHQTNNFIF